MADDDPVTALHLLIPTNPFEEIPNHSLPTSGTNPDLCSQITISHDTSFSHDECSNERAHFDKRYRARILNWKDFYTVIYYVLYVFGTLHLWRMVYRILPLRTTSRVVGRLAKIRLPRWLRGPVYRCYGWFTRANLEEIEYYDDLSQYHSLADFFQRSLLPTARMIDPTACLVSPVDGRVLSCGRVEAGHLEQVKGLFYTLRGLLGPNTWTKTTQSPPTTESDQSACLHHVRSDSDLTLEHRMCVTGLGLNYLPVYPLANIQVDKTATPVLGRTRGRAQSNCAASKSVRLEDYLYAQSLLIGPKKSPNRDNACYSDEPRNLNTATTPHQTKVKSQPTDLYHLLVYLAPGDYHGFHSPTDWIIQLRRHFPGKLYSVAPPFVRQLDRLYCTNERVIYVGQWEYGFFAYVAVGATNVGSIGVFKDPSLVTNEPIYLRQLARIWPQAQCNASNSDYRDLQFAQPIVQVKGELFGQFNFGSTVILVFEAPTDSFQFTVAVGSPVKVGQAVGSVI